ARALLGRWRSAPAVRRGEASRRRLASVRLRVSRLRLAYAPASVAGRTDVSERLRRERFDRVNAGGVPEHEAFDMFEPRGLDLVLDVGEGVRAAKGKVLQPWDEHRLAPGQLGAEVAQRIRHR